MASGDTKTESMLNILGNGGNADAYRGCCNTKTQSYILDAIDRVQDIEDEIEELKNNPDVVDIVATYADLQAYDTQHLTDKDIIRVLQDETHDGESTYYRYNKQTDTWTYIGESKQYTNFVGTDGTTAGEAGLVPAPAATDAGKFLKADGTWDTAGGGGPTVVQTTGTSTTDVMSQNAVTSMVFDDPGTNSKIKIGSSSNSPGANAIQIGKNAMAKTESVTIGEEAKTYGANQIAIGRGATITNPSARGCIALGDQTQLTGAEHGVMSIGNVVSTSYGYNNSNYRLLSGVYDGQSAHDAATYGQVISYSAINGAGAPTTATEGKYVGQLYYDTTNEAMYFLKTIDTTTTPATYTWEALGGGGSGGGGATKLTSADYNYKYGGGDPDGIAPWLLDEGMYVLEDGITVYRNYASRTNASGNGLIVMAKSTSTHNGSFIFTFPNQRPELTYNVETGLPLGTTLPFPVLITNTLTSTSTINALSAKQGKALKDMIDEIVPQTNTLSTSAPTTSTVGVLGQLYTDTTNMHTYQCTAISGSTYTWTMRW